MTKVKMLTQENCTNCVALKQFLEFGLNNKYKDNIEIIKREENPEKFNELVNKFDIYTSPALIFNNDVLTDCSPSNVMNFFEKNIK